MQYDTNGKVEPVRKTDGSSTIHYQYDATGNRTVKRVDTKDLATNVVTTVSTYYVCDAQGNVLATYDNNQTALKQKELFLYGSSRLGVFKPGARNLVTGTYTRSLALKDYELTDHLSNVRPVVSDYRESGSGSILQAKLQSYANYYAFGLEMPDMNYNAYRYGFNGKEKDVEFQSNYDYRFRIFNSTTLSIGPEYESKAEERVMIFEYSVRNQSQQITGRGRPSLERGA